MYQFGYRNKFLGWNKAFITSLPKDQFKVNILSKDHKVLFNSSIRLFKIVWKVSRGFFHHEFFGIDNVRLLPYTECHQQEIKPRIGFFSYCFTNANFEYFCH